MSLDLDEKLSPWTDGLDLCACADCLKRAPGRKKALSAPRKYTAGRPGKRKPKEVGDYDADGF